MDHFKSRGAAVVSITSGRDSPMSRASEVAVTYSIPPDMGAWGLLPLPICLFKLNQARVISLAPLLQLSTPILFL
jgi:D-arabinose 5-phosphate isomerase GutQ